MSFLSLLKNLPASNSPAGKLNALDIQKTLRMAVVVLVGAFVIAFGGSLTAACNPTACDLTGIGVKTVFLDALQAAVSAAGAAGMELLRRLWANHLS